MLVITIGIKHYCAIPLAHHAKISHCTCMCAVVPRVCPTSRISTTAMTNHEQICQTYIYTMQSPRKEAIAVLLPIDIRLKSEKGRCGQQMSPKRLNIFNESHLIENTTKKAYYTFHSIVAHTKTALLLPRLHQHYDITVTMHI